MASVALFGRDYQLGWKEAFIIRKSVIGLMVKFYPIVYFIVQAKGNDVIKDLGVSGRLVFKKVGIRAYRDFNCFNHHICIMY